MLRSLILLPCVCVGSVLTAGCGSADRQASDVQVDIALDPSPPVVGDAQVTLRLTGADGKRLDGAEVRLEGNMNHAGMKPSFANLRETEPGRYAGTLEFTMGGDWFILVTATLPDGRRIEHKTDVPGVDAS